MIDHDVPKELAAKIAEMNASSSRLFAESTEDLSKIVSFVEEEMKGQNLPDAGRGRDAFVASTFEQIYPKVLNSDTCRQAVENMMRKHPSYGDSQPFAHRDENPNYAIGPALAETLYVTGSAIVGSILMVTSGESGGSTELLEKRKNH
ncbi:hypothetical protein [Paludifilum halophilum]|uniref:Uncharacterized protein n=1 Tax=Paludifilum halophilum TaxID=1642702 RepID=A0A235B567_9BACL|nr:hypothetical protein [Paludifilum halophilum]OYD06755.1 hypothetical protein CHM34_14430 [Paludifilum halophilum]